jgi:hypothetical protein
MKKHLFNSIVLAVAVLAGCMSKPTPAPQPKAPPAPQHTGLGYTDTPMLPSGKWHVHDPARPIPPVVTPGATFSDAAPPPSDAIVLFDGQDLSHWLGDKGKPQWRVQDGYMEIVPHSGYIHTREQFGDCQLHLEWAEPAVAAGDSQDRGNSGVFLQGIYEVQILDNYDNPTYADGLCGGLYGQSPPLANACKKPGEWQSYDIVFQTARFGEDHKLIRPASVTVFQNGVLLHHKQALLGPTGWRILANYNKQTPARGPIALQDHGNPVRFRNIWIRNIAEEEAP